MSEFYYIDAVLDDEAEPLPGWLEDRLQRLFAELANEPLPERFVRLLRQLKDAQSQ